MHGSQDPPSALLRQLPSVDKLLSDARVAALVARDGRATVVAAVRGALERWRERLASAAPDPARATELGARIAAGGVVDDVLEALAAEARSGVVRVVNATGVVLHTGLGRAPVHPEVAEAMATAARSYVTAEVDRESGERNQRDARLGELVARATGAEAAICVNNCAGATLLALNTFGLGREIVVSRGELVEIGGSFRMPDVMVRAGTELVEVGTTNRTRIGDYEAAIGPRTGALMKVHTSNYRVQGFTESTTAGDLVELGRRRDVGVIYDLGSGRVELDSARALDVLGDEVRVRDAVATGADLVLFSGDKLVGGPQAGFVIGRADAVALARKNPLYRALRLDKVMLAGLERTFELLLAGRGDELPTRAMLCSGERELRDRAEGLAAELAALDGFTVAVEPDTSQPGSGTAPLVGLPTWVVRVAARGRSAGDLARALRLGEPPVFARIQDERLVLDPRTLLDGDPERLIAAFRALA